MNDVFCLLSRRKFLRPVVISLFRACLLGQSRNCVFIEYLFCFHLVYIVIVKKKSSATEISCCTKNATIMESLPRNDDK